MEEFDNEDNSRGQFVRQKILIDFYIFLTNEYFTYAIYTIYIDLGIYIVPL